MPMEELTETLEMIRDTARQFTLKELIPVAKKIDEEDWFPVDLFRRLGALGFLGITIPEAYGGSGLSYEAQAVIQEELGYGSASFALTYGAHSNLVVDSIFRNGSEDLRKKYLPKLISGEWLGCLCLTEPGSGSDALAMKTRATKKDGKYYLSGSKTLITNAPFADVMLVYARTEDEYTAFIVESSDKGVSKGKKFDKMGMRGSPTGELLFENVELTEDRVLGNEGEGKEVILSGLNAERVILSFIFVGLERRAIELSLRYAIDRKQFNRSISDFEMIQEKIAYMYTKYQTTKLLCNRALEKISHDKMDVMDSAASIMHAAEASESIARDAIQIMGGTGYMRDSEVERLLRDAILGQIGAGTTEIRKKLISSAVVKYFRENDRIPE